uniref:Uncharacterized protein n=1 Tax=Rhizophora mucronata TaxID=61149 RepID=A0A2P2PKT3_RHIMU
MDKVCFNIAMIINRALMISFISNHNAFLFIFGYTIFFFSLATRYAVKLKMYLLLVLAG